MANEQPATSKRARPRRGDQTGDARRRSQNGDGEAAATYEQQLVHFLQERIKPGLSRGAIRLLTRSVAKRVAHPRPGEDPDAAGEPSGQEDDDVRDEVYDDDVVRGEADDDLDDAEDDDVRGEADDDLDDAEDDDVRGEADDDFSDEDDGSERSLEDEMRDLQSNLGDDWIVRVCVQGDYAWLTAEKDDGSQYVEAPAADVLAEVVELLNVSGGRSS
jgi:hypothetical protein